MFCLAVYQAHAGDIRFDDAWIHQRFSLFSKNNYALKGNSLGVRSDGSVSLIYRRLDPALWGAGAASWNWQVQTSVPATDLARKGGDDRNLSISADSDDTDSEIVASVSSLVIR